MPSSAAPLRAKPRLTGPTSGLRSTHRLPITPAVLRRWCRSLLLPLLLLLGQQGAFLHELSHLSLAPAGVSVAVIAAQGREAQGHGPHNHDGHDSHHGHSHGDDVSPAGSHDGPGDDSDSEHSEHSLCSLCLAFAGLGSLALPAALALPLRTDLRHADVGLPAATSLALAGPACRNRGPPDFL